ncbi:MAG: RNA-binding protein [Gemmataceae bacterium]
MGKKLYVGNLPYDVDSSGLEQMFAEFGTVQSAQVITDRDTGRSKGFGFVEMGSDAEAQAAITAMSGKQVGGRSLTVNEAKPKEDRGGGGGGRGGYGGGGGGRGGYGGGGGAAAATAAAAAATAGGSVTNQGRRPDLPRRAGRRTAWLAW